MCWEGVRFHLDLCMNEDVSPHIMEAKSEQISQVEDRVELVAYFSRCNQI